MPSEIKIKSVLDSRIERRAGTKQADYEALREKFGVVAPERLLERYRRYVGAVSQGFHDCGVEWAKHYTIEPGESKIDPWNSEDWFEKQVRSIRSELDNSAFIERLSLPMAEGKVPEIWADPVAYEEFKATFFEYLAFVATQPTWHKVPKSILEKIGCKRCSEPTPEQLEADFTRFLRDHGGQDLYR